MNEEIEENYTFEARHTLGITKDEFVTLPAETKQKMYENSFKVIIRSTTSSNSSNDKYGRDRAFNLKAYEWCRDNCSSLYLIEREKHMVSFLCPEEAAGFKLTWS